MSRTKKYMPWIIAAGTLGALWWLSKPEGEGSSGAVSAEGTGNPDLTGETLSGTAKAGAGAMQPGATRCDGPVVPSFTFAGRIYA